jgi:hypothetical protein
VSERDNRERVMTAAELAVLEQALPEGLTGPMADAAGCLFAALVLADERCGTKAPEGEWLAQLQAWASMCLMQLSHLAQEMGGASFYLAKGVAVFMSARDRAMCAEFRGNNYKALARKYGLTDVRVRSIVDAWQKENYAKRQGQLPLG